MILPMRVFGLINLAFVASLFCLLAAQGQPNERRGQISLDYLGAAGWSLTAEQVVALDKASAVTPIYPYWHQHQFAERNPLPV